MYKFFSSFLIAISLFSFSISAQNQTAEDFFEQGAALLNEKKYDEALTAFQRSVRLDNKNAAAHANIGSVLMRLERINEAAAAFREAIKLAPDEGSFYTALCFALSVSKKHDEAVSHCETGVRLGGNSAQSHVALIGALLTAKRTADANQKVEYALQKFPDEEPLLNIAAQAFEDAGNFLRAAEIYEKLSVLKPKEAYYQVNLAENYLRLERDSDALAAAQKALETDPKHYLAYFFTGKIYFELGQHEEAVNAFQKSVEINPQSSETLFFLAMSEIKREKPVRAIPAFQAALAIEPGNFEYNKQLGLALSKAHRLEESVAPLKKALEINAKDFETVADLGVILMELARFEEAIKYLMTADQLKPGNQIVNMFLGVARSRQQSAPRISEMIAYAKENPNDLSVRLHLVQNLTYNQRMSEAEPYFEEIWKMNPQDVRVYDLIGTLHTDRGNYTKAAEAYRKSIEVGQSPAAYLGLANVYAKNGQVSEAVAAYEKVFELKPDSPNIMKLYADYLRDNGKRREALQVYKRSIAILPNNAPVIFNIGLLSAKLGDLDSAKQYAEMLKPLDPPLAKLLSRCIKLRW